MGGYLIVAVQEDEYVKKFKPQAELVYNQYERIEMIKALNIVDEVILYKEVDDIIKNIQYDIFAKGPDQKHDGFIRATEYSLKHGKEVIVIERTDGISSSMIRNEIKKELSR